ncbi:MAG TPA: hypothetical protein VI685_14140 [Candidatus Angelobacter sp.]
MAHRLLFTVLALLSLSAAASFDPPRSKKTVVLGRSPSRPHTPAKVNCYFYSGFMVKEVDLGEKGADRLSIVPIEHGVMPGCVRTKSKREMAINQDEWSGYFKGVKNGLVFFDADDGWNGGMPFAIYDSRTGKRVFNDAAVGKLEFLPSQGHEVSLRYTRIVEGECNALKDPGACWAQIQKTIGLENTAVPDCKKGYEKSAQDMAKGRCQARNSANPQCVAKELQLARDQANSAVSVIAYPVEVTLSPQAVIKAVPGDLKCWPAD